MKKVAVVYHSGFGHTAYAALKIAHGLEISGKNSVHIVGIGEKSTDWELLGQMDAMIFGSPTYMGNVSAKFKLFMEESVSIWMKQGWANKLAAGFTTSGSPSGDKLSSLQSLVTFSLQHGMIWTGYNRMPETNFGVSPSQAKNQLGSFTGLMLQAANTAPEEAFSEGDIASAIDFGQRVSAVLELMR